MNHILFIKPQKKNSQHMMLTIFFDTLIDIISQE